MPVGEPPPVPVELELLLEDAELLDAELLDAELLDAELLDAELLDAELLLDDAELLDAELLDAVLVPVPAPPAPPPPALLVEVLVPPPAPVVAAEIDVELGDEDSSALDAPPVPSSVPAAQLAGAVATRTEPAARRVNEAARRPMPARPDAKRDRGDMARTSITRAARAATLRASGETARGWCSVRTCEP